MWVHEYSIFNRGMKDDMVRAERYSMLNKWATLILGYIQLLVQQINEYQLQHIYTDTNTIQLTLTELLCNQTH